MTAHTLSEAADEYVAEHAAPASIAAAAIRRAYMAGALETLTCGRPREHVLAELVQYGKTIGSAVERAV